MVVRFQVLGPDDPSEVGGYQLRARLGSGGMGSVYLSFTRGGLPVAVKVMRREFADDPEFRRRFTKEVAAAQRVQGRYTAQVLDADPGAPVPWLATAYIPGPSLHNAVAEYGPLPLFSVFRLLAGTAEGIANVHAAGLVHRDLKPANVLLAADGPRVIDFGIVHAADASSLTGTGQVIGTPAFMAPEQISGRRVTAATDVWAFGHLAVYAAAGHAAFGEGIQSVLIHRIINDEPQLEDCPEPLRELAQRCLAKDPADRPTVDAILDYTSSALRGQTMRLVGESWLPEPIMESLQDYDSRTISLVTQPVPSVPPPHQPTTPALPSRQLRPGRKPALALAGAAVLVAAALLIARPWQGASAQAPPPSANTSAPPSSALKPLTASVAAPSASTSSALSTPPVVGTPKVTYLSDLTPVGGTSTSGSDVTINGVDYPHSVVIFCLGSDLNGQQDNNVEYDVGLKGNQFSGLVGIGDTENASGIAADVSFYGDGNLLKTARVTLAHPELVNFSLAGVLRLEISVFIVQSPTDGRWINVSVANARFTATT